MDGLATQPDKTPREGRKMREVKSLISYYILKLSGTFSAVAIQLDSAKGKKPTQGYFFILV